MDVDKEDIISASNDQEISLMNNNSIVSSNSETSVILNSFYYTDNIANEINLLKIISDIGAPLYAYECIMNWLRKFYMSKYTFDSKLITYQQTIKYLKNQLQFNIYHSVNIPVKLHQVQFLLHVFVSDVKMMFSLLFGNPRIKCISYLAVSSPICFLKFYSEDK